MAKFSKDNRQLMIGIAVILTLGIVLFLVTRKNNCEGFDTSKYKKVTIPVSDDGNGGGYFQLDKKYGNNLVGFTGLPRGKRVTISSGLQVAVPMYTDTQGNLSFNKDQTPFPLNCARFQLGMGEVNWAHFKEVTALFDTTADKQDCSSTIKFPWDHLTIKNVPGMATITNGVIDYDFEN